MTLEISGLLFHFSLDNYADQALTNYFTVCFEECSYIPAVIIADNKGKENKY